jgi:hypothetical protein
MGWRLADLDSAYEGAVSETSEKATDDFSGDTGRVLSTGKLGAACMIETELVGRTQHEWRGKLG